MPVETSYSKGLQCILKIHLTGIDRKCVPPQAQRRFRERQKTKFTELTSKVEELEGRLGELLSEKTRLEDRTSILEQTLEMRSATSLDADEVIARRLSSVVRAPLGLQCAAQRPTSMCQFAGGIGYRLWVSPGMQHMHTNTCTP